MGASQQPPEREVYDPGRQPEGLGIRAARRLPPSVQASAVRRSQTQPSLTPGRTRQQLGQRRGTEGSLLPRRSDSGSRRRSTTPGRTKTDRRGPQRSETPQGSSCTDDLAERRLAFDDLSAVDVAPLQVHLSQTLARCQRMALALAQQRSIHMWAGGLMYPTPDLLESEDGASRRMSDVSAATVPSSGWLPTDDDLNALDTLLNVAGPERACKYCVSKLRKIAEANRPVLQKELAADGDLAQLVRGLVPATAGSRGDRLMPGPGFPRAGGDASGATQRGASLAFGFAKLIGSCKDVLSASERMQSCGRDLLQAESFAVYVAEDSYLVTHVHDEMSDASFRVRIPRTSGVPGLVAASGAAINVADPSTDPRLSGIADGTSAVLATPMWHQGELLGVAHATNKRGARCFSAADAALADSFAEYCAGCLYQLGCRAPQVPPPQDSPEESPASPAEEGSSSGDSAP
eukprot:TRINITY_DN12635_c0_g1_i1.p1 TRINITY_DN12635_c0_g1~~TRINITY_DN12635_c0_g1_i1.p1  ORF type:complete len:480 (+),score=63.47 TRINITY_DN12635_c0_g1_i1:55-1440(+)